MPRVSFTQLPDRSRLWIFAASRPLAAAEQASLLGAVDVFLDQWHAHGAPLDCGKDLQYGQFLIVGVDEEAAGVSGCSVDSLVRTMKTLGQDLGVELIDYRSVFYRDARGVQRVSRDEFAESARDGAVTSSTIVFDNTVATAGALRAGRWEAPAAETWHGRAFFQDA